MRVQVIKYIGFAHKEPVRYIDFWNVFRKGLYGVKVFE